MQRSNLWSGSRWPVIPTSLMLLAFWTSPGDCQDPTLLQNFLKNFQGIALQGGAAYLVALDGFESPPRLVPTIGVELGITIQEGQDAEPPGTTIIVDGAYKVCKDWCNGVWAVTLSFGIDHIGGLELDPIGTDSITLQGAVNTLPTISAYAFPSVPLSRKWQITPFFGATVGFAKLAGMGAEIATTDTAGAPILKNLNVEASTMEVGAAIGLFHVSGLFLEAHYRHRVFDQLEWFEQDDRKNQNPRPAGAPSSLNTSTFVLRIGFSLFTAGN